MRVSQTNGKWLTISDRNVGTSLEDVTAGTTPEWYGNYYSVPDSKTACDGINLYGAKWNRPTNAQFDGLDVKSTSMAPGVEGGIGQTKSGEIALGEMKVLWPTTGKQCTDYIEGDSEGQVYIFTTKSGYAWRGYPTKNILNTTGYDFKHA